MSLSKSLNQITESGFNKMPHSIAKVISDGIEELKTGNLASNTLKVGEAIPDIPLIVSETGKKTSLRDFISNDFLILNFYRGGWCPYCNLELRAYDQLKDQFERASTNIVSISAELPEYAQSTTTRNKLSHPVLTDLNGTLSKKIGIYFHLNKDLQREYSNFGINLSELHGNDENGLLVPATFVIDRDMNIVWAHVEENYMTRAEPTVILNELVNLKVIQE
ncbi:peroxiredoxin-like family protein [Flavivirga abyssicola]|uniref:peroxiredoxin-like family protein n=1 Tax=Flavivirga abyssicola TaxID=3063533 RepID=UPI0026DF6B45|nr:peroxiredoxin-like family protein [Flavivirga sp. MEBiC07777]WVK12474.1 peroxiredoxin-like family protein [Flavivirga sp. MEBiC07777]